MSLRLWPPGTALHPHNHALRSPEEACDRGSDIGGLCRRSDIVSDAINRCQSNQSGPYDGPDVHIAYTQLSSLAIGVVTMANVAKRCF